MARGLLDLWLDLWTIQIVVLLSLTLQVVLLVFAGIRRRKAHPVLRFLLWSAYLLADSTATYALGHLSFSSVPREHRLVAFWAPFLLMHLGGPDNITAYALQDNQLWPRHLLTLIVQVVGAAYVLYKHIASTGTLVLLAAILIFAVGFVKYAERTWALQCGDMASIRRSLKKEPRNKCKFYIEDEPPQGKENEEEFLVRHAHSLFHICHDAVIALMEIELSLLYDILYTKAAVIHSNMFGYFIRAASPLAIAASLLLFHFSGKDGHSRVDFAITYVLLAGAFLLEMISLLSALGSSWTLAFLCAKRWSWIRHAVLCAGRWDQLRRVVVSFNHFLNITGISSFFRLSRRWSGTMGQYNMLHRCTGSLTILGGLAKMLGREEWWDRRHYSGTVAISEDVKKSVYEHTREIRRDVNTLGIIRNDWGKKTIKSSLEKLNKDVWKSIKLEIGPYSYGLDDVLKFSRGVEFQEGIIIWHIGTDVFLAESSRAKAEAEAEAVAPVMTAIRELSNYMMFLLVKRPDMLPGIAQARLYDRIYECLVKAVKTSGQSRRNFCTTIQELFRLHKDDPGSRSRLLQRERFACMLPEIMPNFDFNNSRLHYAIKLAKGLRILERDHKFDSLVFVLHMWTDFLVYAANRCSRESHAKRLSTGGEFTTVIWLMQEHLNQVSLTLAEYQRKQTPQ